MSKAIEDVLAERRRQVAAEGWSPEHDDDHVNGELAWAAVCYLQNAAVAAKMQGLGVLTAEQCLERATTLPMPQVWPWEATWWKPAGQRRDLVKATALLIAEIERIDRADGRAATPSAQPVQDTWFTDRALPVMAISADVESNRVLKLHFRRPVTDDDRKALCDALNMHQAALSANGGSEHG